MIEKTIVALCTAQGKGAISVLRLSGPQALLITRSMAGFLPQKMESHKSYFGTLSYKGQKLDEVLLTYFKKGHSFTGEESVEISCHGGGVYSDILEALIEEGARPAQKGEFSLQAFSNGKMDLTQAEGLLQLIESESRSARTESLKQLKGELSKKLLKIEKKWLFLLSHIEADIDFSLENLNTLTENQIQEEIQNLLKELNNLISSYQPFEKLQKGLVFGIFGSVNAGKSSLFNALLSQEKAIVSKEEGTTRDIVEAQILNPKGLNILLKDSAGFRESKSEGEKKGQAKSLELLKDSDYRLIVIDLSYLESQLKQKKEQGFLKDKTLKGREVTSNSKFCKDKDFENKGLENEDLEIYEALETLNNLPLLKKEDFFLGLKKLNPSQKSWLVFTKTDLLNDNLKNKTYFNRLFLNSPVFRKDKILQKFEEVFFVSSLTKEGLSELKEKMLVCGARNQENFLLTNSRHYEALNKMKELLLKCHVKQKIQENKKNRQGGEDSGEYSKKRSYKQNNQEESEESLSLDIMALNLQEGLMALYEILGKQVDDKVLDQIFEKFCIGK